MSKFYDMDQNDAVKAYKPATPRKVQMTQGEYQALKAAILEDVARYLQPAAKADAVKAMKTHTIKVLSGGVVWDSNQTPLMDNEQIQIQVGGGASWRAGTYQQTAGDAYIHFEDNKAPSIARLTTGMKIRKYS
jgi:outer membrane scaffolding protein for murein synthesis (MipA/OmpV family)